MTATVTAEQRAARARAAAVGAGGDPPGDRLRRSRGRLAAAVVLMVLGGWVAAALVLSSGDRVEVVAVAQPVEAGETVERGDLRVVRVAADASVATVPAAELEGLVGRAAAGVLVEGSLLAPGAVAADGERLVGAGDAVVGVLTGPGDAPVGLTEGAEVMVVVRLAVGAGGEASSEPVSGWVRDVGPSSATSDEQVVSVVVAAVDAADVSAAAAERRVSIVVLGGS